MLQVRERPDCLVRMFIRHSVLLSGNIDCKRKHFVLERRAGQYVMHKKPQRPQQRASQPRTAGNHFMSYTSSASNILLKSVFTFS